MKLKKLIPDGDSRRMIEQGLLLMAVIATVMYLVALLNPSLPHPSPLFEREGAGVSLITKGGAL